MKVLIVAGGSGGHIFPALALSQELSRQKDTKIIFVASKRNLDRKILSGSPFKKLFLSINPMPYSLDFKVVPFIIKLVYDLFMSLFILVAEKPKIVVGFGGYTAGSIVMLASFMGIKTIIHEQNLVPGRANRLLDKFVNAVAISFEDSKIYFKNINTVFTGNPLRNKITHSDKRNTYEILGLNENKFTMLVMGGSQGARSLNTLVSSAIKELEDNIKMNLQVIHITGVRDIDTVSSSYREGGILAKTFSFIENIHNVYGITDLAISRSGAAAIFELSLYGIPMVLIPYPFKGNNQRFNASYFAGKGAAVYREEDGLSIIGLRNLIKDLIVNDDRLKRLSEGARKLSCPDATKRLANEVIKLVR